MTEAAALGKHLRRWSGLIIAVAVAGCAAQPLNATKPMTTEAPAAPAAATPAAINIPIEYYKLDNGLKVVLSRDATAPTVTVGVYYHIGFRIEPRGRTGFAHLFEHLMFQGSGNLGKMEFIRLVEGNGGVLNGSTRFDFTNYFQIVPAHVLETVLWAEADRMKALAITQANLANQQGVVKNEVRDATHEPAVRRLSLAHDAAGREPELVQRAQLLRRPGGPRRRDARGRDSPSSTRTTRRTTRCSWSRATSTRPRRAPGSRSTSRPIPARAQPPRPDLTEPVRTAEKRDSYVDRLAPRPALALAWQVPPRNTPEHYAFSLLDTILLQGEDSRLWQKLVQERGYAGAVGGGTNLLGNEFTYDGPMLWMLYLIHDPAATPEAIIADVDAEIARIQAEPPSPEELDRALTKLRASLYDLAGSSTRFGLLDLLACFALFDDDPARINRLEADFRAVPPELIRDVARNVPDARAPHGADRPARPRRPPPGGLRHEVPRPRCSLLLAAAAGRCGGARAAARARRAARVQAAGQGNAAGSTTGSR